MRCQMKGFVHHNVWIVTIELNSIYHQSRTYTQLLPLLQNDKSFNKCMGQREGIWLWLNLSPFDWTWKVIIELLLLACFPNDTFIFPKIGIVTNQLWSIEDVSAQLWMARHHIKITTEDTVKTNCSIIWSLKLILEKKNHICKVFCFF